MRYTAFISHSARKAVGVLMLLLLLGVQVGCRAVYEDPEAPLAVDANLRLLFAVPNATKAATIQDYGDSANQEGMDNALNSKDLEVYFFTEAGEFITSVTGPRNLDVSPYSSGAYNPHYHMYSADIRVEGVVNGQRCRVVIVAHRRSWQYNFLPFCVATETLANWLDAEGSTDEEKLYKSLYFNFSNSGVNGPSDYARYNYKKESDVTVPMWGFNTLNLKLATINQYGYHDPVEPSGQIDMLRSIAKVRIDINPDLLDLAEVTSFDQQKKRGGIRLFSPMNGGYMTPAYKHVNTLTQTPDILNKDKTGGVPSGEYTDVWINQGTSLPVPQVNVYPFYKSETGSYYMYLPEHLMGQAWMSLEFRYVDSGIIAPYVVDKKLFFADYDAAIAKRDETLGVLGDIPLTEEQLEDFQFPVMRNHYYIYEIIKLDPLVLKYEICDWSERIAPDIIFN